jgi:hypothetical protein
LDKIKKLSSHFLWTDNNASGGMHLTKWSTLATPKALGGWGIKYIRLFAKYLAGRNLWRLLVGNSLWIKVMHSKYFPNLTVIEWLRQLNKSSKGSIVWKALVEAFPLVGEWVVWKIGDRKNIRVGEDPWLGARNNFRLSPPLIQSLQTNNIHSLHDVCIGFP